MYDGEVLQRLRLEGDGPAKRLETDFSERLNLITGDNGLGKSFLLDIACWALTRTWPRKDRGVLPRDDARKPVIHAAVRTKGREAIGRDIEFDLKTQQWVQPRARPQKPGLVLRPGGWRIFCLGPRQELRERCGAAGSVSLRFPAGFGPASK